MQEPDGCLYFDLVRRDGSAVLSGVRARLASPVITPGDRWTAAAANLLLELDESGAPQLAIRPDSVGGLTDCTHAKSGRVHQLTGQGRDLRLTAQADFTAGDSFTLNGRPVEARTAGGEVLWTGFFKKGAVVICHLSGSVLTFEGGGKDLKTLGLSFRLEGEDLYITCTEGSGI